LARPLLRQDVEDCLGVAMRQTHPYPLAGPWHAGK
jgi:hypothetical protein